MSSIPNLTEPMFWSEAMKRAIVSGDAASAGMELLRMDAGFSLVPTIDKEPIMRLSDDGRRRPETNDPIVWRQWLALWPDAEIGLVPGGMFAFLDKDHPGNGAPYLTGLEHGYREEKSVDRAHGLVRVPDGRALKSSPINGFGHVKAGRSYCRFMANDYKPVDIEAPILTLPDDSPVWAIAERVTNGTLATSILPTTIDREHARKLDLRIREHSMYREGYAAMFTSDWQEVISPDGDRSESGRDFFLVFIASHFVRDNPHAAEILYALLWDTGWASDPHRDHPKYDPQDYCSRTVSSALNARTAKDTTRLHQFIDRYILPTSDTPSQNPGTNTTPETVIDANFRNKGQRFREIDEVIWNFAGSDEIDEYTRENRWRRFPVVDVAEVFGVDREAIRKRMVKMEHEGLIERRSTPYKHDGRCRRDTCIRLPGGAS